MTHHRLGLMDVKVAACDRPVKAYQPYFESWWQVVCSDEYPLYGGRIHCAFPSIPLSSPQLWCTAWNSDPLPA